MKFVKCKNESEKLQAILAYCSEEIRNADYNINSYISSRASILDYADEIHDLRLYKARLETITRIIEADENTSIMI